MCKMKYLTNLKITGAIISEYTERFCLLTHSIQCIIDIK